MVNEQQLRGSWNEIQGQLRKHWGQLNQDDVLAFGGNVDQLVGMIQRKTGDSRETIENFLNHLVEQGADGTSRFGEFARHATERAGEMGRQTYDNTRRFVEQRPATSLAALFGAGIIAGLGISLLSTER